MYPDNEPDILQFTTPDNSVQNSAKADLTNLSEKAFRRRYKATKRLYSALIRGLETLDEVQAALLKPGPLEIDPEIIENTGFLITDLKTLMEQMHMAAVWEQEGI